VVFVRGFSSMKSQTHPYEYPCIDGVWVTRDTERSRPQDYRKEEWITYGGDPSAVDALARQHTRGRLFIGAMCDLSQSTAEMRDAYKALGYRLLGSEPLFVHRLKRIPQATAAVRLEQVGTSELAERFAKATRSRPIAPEHLNAKRSCSPVRRFGSRGNRRLGAEHPGGRFAMVRQHVCSAIPPPARDRYGLIGAHAAR